MLLRFQTLCTDRFVFLKKSKKKKALTLTDNFQILMELTWVRSNHLKVL